MKSAVLLCGLLANFAVAACEQGLAGFYGLRNSEGAIVEALHLKLQDNKLVAYTKNESGQWELNPHQPQPYSAQAFSAFTKLPAPANYCGVLVSGAVFARVSPNWQWGPFTIKSGFTFITLGGAHEVQRVRP